MKKSFTINCNRSFDDIHNYGTQLIETGIYQACELFYPNPQDLDQTMRYSANIKWLQFTYPNIEFVFHLPFSEEYNIGNGEVDSVYRLEQAIIYASSFGVKRATLHPGRAKTLETREKDIKVAIKNIKQIKKFASQHNITIMLENLVSPFEFMTTLDEIIYVLHECQCGFTLDVGHAAVCGLDINEVIHKTNNFLMHTHIHDNHFETDEHLPIGSGNIDFKSILQTLKDTNYKYLYGMEALFTTYEDLKLYAKLLDNQIEGE